MVQCFACKMFSVIFLMIKSLNISSVLFQTLHNSFIIYSLASDLQVRNLQYLPLLLVLTWSWLLFALENDILSLYMCDSKS